MLTWSVWQRLSDAQVSHLFPALFPVLQSWQTREREAYLLDSPPGFLVAGLV